MARELLGDCKRLELRPPGWRDPLTLNRRYDELAGFTGHRNTNEMTPDNTPEGPAERSAADRPDALAEERKVAARRRFLRGASGGAALVLTVPHRRAYAVKKGTLLSNCISLQGVPDLKNVTNKKAIEVSAMGTPKGSICRPRSSTPDPNPVGICTPQGASKYRNMDGNKVPFVKESELKHGCGSVLPGAMPPDNTISASYNYRLYEKGYCPIVWQGDNLVYDGGARYYEIKDGVLVPRACNMP